MKPQLTPQQRESINAAIRAGRKIEAIKQLREVSGLGLKDARDVVEALEGELRAEDPTSIPSAATKKGCASVLLLSVLVGSSLWFLLLS